MKSALYLLITLFAFNASANVSIQNFFSVDEKENVFRGREPGKKIAELQSMNVSDVIIFKNDVRGEVEKELADLELLGMSGHHIPFHWKDIPSMQGACEQVIEALTIIKKVTANGGSVYFHCTAGEDRTGMLSGLFRMLNEGLDQETVFAEEMCAKGYSDGNPKKPQVVTSAIERGLTPLFITMAKMIEDGKLSLNKLDKKVCKNIKITKETKSCAN